MVVDDNQTHQRSLIGLDWWPHPPVVWFFKICSVLLTGSAVMLRA
jgi:hypothetical protein